MPRNIVEIEVKVRYPECDPAGVAHHSVFPVWMELARTELLRQAGLPYVELTRRGILFVVARMTIRFRRPVFYDDTLRVRTWAGEAARARVEYEHEIYRGDQLMATGQVTLVCVDRDNRPQPIPDDIQLLGGEATTAGE